MCLCDLTTSTECDTLSFIRKIYPIKIMSALEKIPGIPKGRILETRISGMKCVRVSVVWCKN